MTFASSAAHASEPRDTIRAGRCDARPITNPDSAAPWRLVQHEWLRERPGGWTNDSLRTVLLALAKADQAMRGGFSAASVKDTAFLRRMNTVDSINSARLHDIFAQFGWPGKSMVGADGSDAAFLVAQHSSTTGPEALALMQAAPRGEVKPDGLALLIDRTRKHAGLPQRYGSQFDAVGNGPFVLYQVEDPAHLELRRARAGLSPLRAYACLLATSMHADVVLPAEVDRYLER